MPAMDLTINYESFGRYDWTQNALAATARQSHFQWTTLVSDHKYTLVY